ncbi:hypothetical protein [Pleomorphovibrio marinus]|uniref:hypothetical protein n=1 Tax=Pleomorphovibrio marinus TaxID=2164132 RepID=UPI000E0A2530|nr:hypothetical protein [Pleomorphovibrio marinus]
MNGRHFKSTLIGDFILLLVPMVVTLFLSNRVYAQTSLGEVDTVRFHLTPNPWEPSELTKERLLQVIEETCTIVAKHQNEEGAIIDPYLNREHQYSTPYFAFAVGTLLNEGKGNHLKEAGIRAMEHCTANFAAGSAAIPDEHGEFFISPLAQSLALFEPFVKREILEEWEQRLSTPLAEVMQNFDGRINNWRTYAMKGEWTRAQLGLVDKSQAKEFVEWAWRSHTQRIRIMNDKHHLYQDWSSDPQSLAVEAVGRGNLIGLFLEGYDGEAREELQRAIKKGTYTSLLLQAPDGQAPANGRTDNHVFNDVLYFLAFEALAEITNREADSQLAGQYKRAANLAFESILRWQRKDEGWEGSFFITKNHFDPSERTGYQPASQWGNYTGAIIQHLSEAVHIGDSKIQQAPAPAEIGGYAFSTDSRFGSFFANAGGMQVVSNLRGASMPKYGRSWTPLGVIRFSKQNWDARLGPSDGEHDLKFGEPTSVSTADGDLLDSYTPQSGITFGPEWQERGRWIRIADVPKTYEATPEIHFVHPFLVKFSLHYSYVTGRGGPYFTQEFIITPDLVVTRLKSPQSLSFGLTVPLLENDGTALELNIDKDQMTTSYGDGQDQQCYIPINREVDIDSSAKSIKSTYGWLKPVRVTSPEKTLDMLVYPRNANDPSASQVKASFSWTQNGFTSILGTMEGDIYRGNNAAGGFGDRFDTNQDGIIDLRFDKECMFVIQMGNGKIKAIETDREVVVEFGEESLPIKAYEPYTFP